MYQFSLSLQMLLLIVFMWTPAQFEMKIEKKLHRFNVISTLVAACIPLFFKGYNPKCGTCRPVPMPSWCGDWMGGDGATECERGDAIMSNIYVFLFWVVLSAFTLFCSGAMVAIYMSVYLSERKMAKYRFSNEDDEGGEEEYPESKRIRQSMLLYSSSFYICWIIPLVLWYAPHGVPSLYVIGDVLFSLMGVSASPWYFFWRGVISFSYQDTQQFLFSTQFSSSSTWLSTSIQNVSNTNKKILVPVYSDAMSSSSSMIKLI